MDDAIDNVADLETVVAYRVPMSARSVIGLAAFDTAIHSWDMSRAIGFDERLDDGLVEFALEFLDWLRGEAGYTEYFPAPKSPLPQGASSQTRLLHLAGRDP